MKSALLIAATPAPVSASSTGHADGVRLSMAGSRRCFTPASMALAADRSPFRHQRTSRATAGDFRASRSISWARSGSPALLAEGDGVRVLLNPRHDDDVAHDLAHVNRSFARLGLPYRVHEGPDRNPWAFTASDGDHAWPYDRQKAHGVFFDRDPVLNKARLAAEALGAEVA